MLQPSLGVYVVTKTRKDGTDRLYFQVPLRLRPDGWSPAIPIARQNGRTGPLADDERPAIIEKGKKLFDQLVRARLGLPEIEAAGSRTMRDLVLSWQKSPEWRSLRPSTKEGYSFNSERVLAWADECGDPDPSLISQPNVRSFLANFDDKPRTKKAVLKVVALIMQQAVALGWRTDNPARGIRVPTPKIRVGIWEQADVREAFSEDTGDAAAKMLANAWAETAEHLRLKFNAAGGSIGKLDNWGMPQAHDSVAVRQAGRQAWIDYVLPRIDRAKMLDETTGQPFTDASLVRALDGVWQSIATHGLNAPVPVSRTGLSALAKRRNDTRFLVFKSADTWMQYQEAFGDADAFSTMMGHLDELSRDIAQMEILGPNPDAQWSWLVKSAKAEAALEEAAGAKGAIDAAESYVSTAQNMLGHFTGSLSTPINSRLAQFGASSRAYFTATMLGSAILSDIPTAPIYGAMARSFVGLSKTGNFQQFAKLLNPADGTARQNARRSGFIIETATDGMIRATSDNLRLLTVGERVEGGLNAFARRAPVAIMRLQGLSAWDAGRNRRSGRSLSCNAQPRSRPNRPRLLGLGDPLVRMRLGATP